MMFDAQADGRRLRVEVRGKDGRFEVSVDGRPLEVDCCEAGPGFLSLLIAGRSYEVGIDRRDGVYTVVFADDAISVELLGAARGAAFLPRKADGGPARITAPMPGKIVRVLASPGQEVAAGAGLLVMEAMKMENELKAPRSGRVRELHAREGQAVETGALLAVLE